MWFNYIFINKSNFKRYVGFTGDVEKRWGEEKNSAFNPNSQEYKKPLYKAIKKYGWDGFIRKIVGQWETKEEALEYEKWLIDYYKINICRYGSNYGYNLTDGGEATFGYKHTDETRLKLSAAKQGVFDGEKNPFYGKKHTETSLNKVRGEKNHAAKLTSKDVVEIREKYAGGDFTHEELGEMYGVNRKHIGDIINRINWRHI